MGIPRIPRDAGDLIHDHRMILDQLRQACTDSDNAQSEIRAATDYLLEEQLLAALREIPVEELNREKRGIRVKTLRDQGYATMADLYRADSRTLEGINGISDTGAVEIKTFAAHLAGQLRPGMKIRLSSDDRSDGASRLIAALYGFRSRKDDAEKAAALLRSSAAIEAAIPDLEGKQKLLRWLFTSREKKCRANAAYALLSGEMSGAYGTEAKALLRRISGKAGVISRSATWEDFGQNSIAYYQLLETICPGALGTDDSRFGLPGELAEAVQAQPLALEGLRCQLRRYQEWGVKYILHQERVLLGDEMGLGKTVQAIAAMVSLRNTGATHFMVVCPASVLENWCREIRRHSDLGVQRIHGADRDAAMEQWIVTGGVGVTTYETAGMFRLAEPFRFSMAIVDEAHYIKNPEAKRSAAVRTLCTHAERLLFMTGTALENRVGEMITLISVLRPEIADSVRDILSISAAPQFRERIAPVYYRRKREDVLTELPDLIEKEEWCALGPEEEAAYECAVLEGRFTDCRRVSWILSDLSRSAKAQRMLELIEDAREENRKIIVFSFFLDTIEKVTGLLGAQCLTPITGSVSPGKRQEIVDEFDRSPAGTVLAAQIQAGGTGLNIQSASMVILCEPQLKPSIENQAISRAYRMGQTRNVLVHRLLCEDTVDERITDLLEKKQREFDAFADESTAARESLGLDQATVGSIVQAEADRISRKRAAAETAAAQ